MRREGLHLRPLVDAILPHREDAALVAREAMTRVGDALGPRTLEEVLLVISELVTNAIRHGPDRGPIHLLVRRDGS